jgi:hypothetical protein
MCLWPSLVVDTPVYGTIHNRKYNISKFVKNYIFPLSFVHFTQQGATNLVLKMFKVETFLFRINPYFQQIQKLSIYYNLTSERLAGIKITKFYVEKVGSS